MKGESVFKHLAEEYIKEDSRRLLVDFENAEKEINFPIELDRKINNKIKNLKLKKYYYIASAIAICFLIFVLGRNFTNFIKTNENKPLTENQEIFVEQNISFVSNNIPEEYELLKNDFDNGKIIYNIKDDKYENYVLTVEKNESVLEQDDLKEIILDNKKAYLLIKNDYSILKFKKENLKYVLTCKYDYDNLINLGKSLI